VLFTNMTSLTGGATLEVVDLESGARKAVQPGASVGRYLDSGHLVYVNDGTLFAAPFDLDRMEVTSAPAPVVSGISETGGAHFDVSRSGTLVYLEGQGGAAKYEMVAVDRRGLASPLVADRQSFVEPHFSPDGRRLAVEILTGSASDSWVYDLDRGTGTRLTFAEGLDSVPVWSPDGKWIAYGSDGKGRVGLYRKRADGSGDEELLLESTTSPVPSSWSPDGRFLLYSDVVSNTGNDIWLLPLEGDRKPQPFLATEFAEAEAAFSPDGRWVAYQSEESGRIEVYVRPFPAGGGKWQISVNGGTHPRWQADGKRLYFRNENQVMTVEVDAAGDALRIGAPAVLFEGPYLQAAIGGVVYADYDVAPDGERFVMLRGEGRDAVPDHLVVVLGFEDELRATFAKR
jgi:serine/threonine-protein kinase